MTKEKKKNEERARLWVGDLDVRVAPSGFSWDVVAATTNSYSVVGLVRDKPACVRATNGGLVVQVTLVRFAPILETKIGLGLGLDLDLE